MRFKGDPLEITYGHYDNDKIHITYGTCKLSYNNFPDELRYSNIDLPWAMFTNTIKVKTYCKHDDSYDPVIGERVVRKKIMKNYMSIVRQLCDYYAKEASRKLDEVKTIRNDVDRCNKSIIEYLKTI